MVIKQFRIIYYLSIYINFYGLLEVIFSSSYFILVMKRNLKNFEGEVYFEE